MSQLDSAPDPVFLQCLQAPIGLTNHYTKLNTNQAIVLVNIIIWCGQTHFLLFLLGRKMELK